ncbi:MAG: transporter [Syntrophobacteraceae bacterium]|nr:transporter [Syntrophobacteraceae bacterium]
MFRIAIGSLLGLMLFSGSVYAARPLITDDTGTQGKGKFQLELGYEFDHDDSGGVEEDIHNATSVLTYGVTDTVDVVVGLPYQFISTKERRDTRREDGISDMTLELKWRFFEWKGLSLAAKPGLSIPTGDDDKGLGAGRAGGSFYFIASQELEPWAFHFNAGYERNENSVNEETDLWHVSLATEVQVSKWLKLVADVGAEKNTDKEDNTPAAFLLGGVILPLTENLDLDFGIKGGLTDPETDYAFLGGVTIRF